MSPNYQSGVVMEWARFKAPSGEVSLIHLDDYQPDEHRGRLCCSDCDVNVYYHSGSPHKNGDTESQSQHFHTYPNQKHDGNCENGRKLSEKNAKTEYDANLGYRFNLDMDFISGMGKENFARKAFSKAANKTSSLRSMEPIPIHSAADMAQQLPRLETERIKKSVVVWHDIQIPWHDFFIRGSGFSDLIDRLQAKGTSTFPPVMLYMPLQQGAKLKPDKDSFDRPRENRACEPFKHLDLGTIERRLCIYDAQAAINLEQSMPVLAICRPSLHQGHKNILYVNIRDERNLVSFDLRQALALSSRPASDFPEPHNG